MDGYGMRYNHYSELPIGAFEPICGRMKLYGGGGDPIQAISDAVSNVGESISNVVSDVGGTIGDLGNQVDQSVNSAIPGGWATVGAAALAAMTMGGSLAAEGAIDAGEGLAAAGEAGAEGTAGATAGADAGAAGGAAAGGVGGAGTVGSDALTSGATLGGSTLGSGYVAGAGTGLTGAGLGATGGEVGTGILTGGGTGAGLGTGLVGSGTGLGLTSAEALTGGLGLNGVTAAGLASSVPTYASGLTASDVANGLRAANAAKNILAPTTTNLKSVSTGSNAPAAINAALSTMPATYKQGNPFTFTQQQPIQDNNQLATLLRKIYGNQPV